MIAIAADTSRSLGINDSDDLPLPEWTKIFISHVVIFSSKVQLAHDYRQLVIYRVDFVLFELSLLKSTFTNSPSAILRLIWRADICWRISALLCLKLLSVLTLSVCNYLFFMLILHKYYFMMRHIRTYFVRKYEPHVECVLVLSWANNNNCKKCNQNYEFLILFCYWLLWYVHKF